jgi:hypothetical protein
MSLAPIALFVYNRPKHTLKTLDALAQNDLASQSELFVFCDGPKNKANSKTLEAIKQVRALVKSEPWCKKVTVYESETNKGLADSIVEGVTQIVNQFGKIIVLEDDIVMAKGFLAYMNRALNLYEYEDKVMHIGSYLPYTNSMSSLPETFFSRFMSCWGWGTWKSAWDKAEWDAKALYEKISAPKTRYEFNLEGVLNYHEQLEDNIRVRIKTWAIMWFSSVFLNNGLCLSPKVSLTDNIGLDGSGEHCEVQDNPAHFNKNQYITVSSILINESKKGKTYLKRYYKYGIDSSFKVRFKNIYVAFRYKLIKKIKGL